MSSPLNVSKVLKLLVIIVIFTCGFIADCRWSATAATSAVSGTVGAVERVKGKTMVGISGYAVRVFVWNGQAWTTLGVEGSMHCY